MGFKIFGLSRVILTYVERIPLVLFAEFETLKSAGEKLSLSVSK
jgi:hypothetical protein